MLEDVLKLGVNLDVDGTRVRLSPGMNPSVEIETGKRRVIDYLLSPLRARSSEALGSVVLSESWLSDATWVMEDPCRLLRIEALHMSPIRVIMFLSGVLASASSASASAQSVELERGTSTHPRLRFELTWERQGSERVCRSLRRLLNDPATTSCALSLPTTGCRLESFDAHRHPEFALPAWRPVDPVAHPSLLRQFSDFFHRANDHKPDRREWQWKNTYAPMFETAIASGRLLLTTAHFDTSNDGVVDHVYRIDIRPGDPATRVAQFVADPSTGEFARNLWDEQGTYTPILFHGRTYWLIWSDPLGWMDDPRYRRPGAVRHVDLRGAPPGQLGNNRPHQFHCTLAALRTN